MAVFPESKFREPHGKRYVISGVVTLSAHFRLPGSIGHLSSAATVAASSFQMRLTDPNDLLGTIHLNRWNHLGGGGPSLKEDILKNNPQYVEPSGNALPFPDVNPASHSEQLQGLQLQQEPSGSIIGDMLTGKVQNLGDFIDTDAVCLEELSGVG